MFIYKQLEKSKFLVLDTATTANGVNFQRVGVVPGTGTGNHKIPTLSHPAPLPDMPNPQPHAPSWKRLPPRPTLKISRLKSGK